VIVAVTGATGYAGQYVVKRLVEAGVGVRAWRRPTSDLSGMPDINWVEGDLDTPASAEALLEGADALVHAALHHVPGRYRGGEGDDLAGFIEANVGGSLRLLAAARAAGVKRCVVFSTRAVFGVPQVTEPILDGEPPRPDTHYGAAKAALEAFVRSWGLADGWPIATLRPTGIYGVISPVERSKWFDVVARALKGESVTPRAGSEVHGRDVAESVWRLLQAEPGAIAGRAFNCSDLVVSTRDIVGLVQRIADVSGPLPDAAPMPTNVMASYGLEAFGVRFGGTELLEETVAELVEAVRQRG
jgi:nucleoside-diphosphate-sugar epimerase